MPCASCGSLLLRLGGGEHRAVWLLALSAKGLDAAAAAVLRCARTLCGERQQWPVARGEKCSRAGRR